MQDNGGGHAQRFGHNARTANGAAHMGGVIDRLGAVHDQNPRRRPELLMAGTNAAAVPDPDNQPGTIDMKRRHVAHQMRGCGYGRVDIGGDVIVRPAVGQSHQLIGAFFPHPAALLPAFPVCLKQGIRLFARCMRLQRFHLFHLVGIRRKR